jgi:putative membrane protein
VHPEAGIAYLGSQGDIWDAQKDMEAALYGALLCVGLLLLLRARRRWFSTSQPNELVGT